MRRESSIMARKTWMACLLALGLCLLTVADVPAGKKNRSNTTTPPPNPSPVGEANGIAHRVAALEAAQAETDEILSLVMERVMTLEDQVRALQEAVLILDARVAALEEAAIEPEPEPDPAP